MKAQIGSGLGVTGPDQCDAEHVLSRSEGRGRDSQPRSPSGFPSQAHGSDCQPVGSRRHFQRCAVGRDPADRLHIHLERDGVARAHPARPGDAGYGKVGLLGAGEDSDGAACQEIGRDLACVFDRTVRHHDQRPVRGRSCQKRWSEERTAAAWVRVHTRPLIAELAQLTPAGRRVLRFGPAATGGTHTE
jgi:hypothetical protein